MLRDPHFPVAPRLPSLVAAGPAAWSRLTNDVTVLRVSQARATLPSRNRTLRQRRSGHDRGGRRARDSRGDDGGGGQGAWPQLAPRLRMVGAGAIDERGSGRGDP